MAPQTRSAIVVKGSGKAEIETDVPVPKLAAGEILARVTAFALNPIDHFFVDVLPQPGSILGCDFAGLVEQVGEGAGTELGVGTRVAGYVPANNKYDVEAGAYASYVKAQAALLMKVPDNLTDIQAATMCVGIVTSGLGLFDTVGLKLPSPMSPAKDPVWVLVYGGSTSTGDVGIQLAKAANLKIVTTSSPSSFEHCRSLGADHVFDYNSPDCASDIRKAVPDLKFCLDCASKSESAVICSAALAPGSGSVYRSLLPVENFPREDVDTSIIQSFEIFGRPMSFGPGDVPIRKEAFDFAKDLLAAATKLAAEGKLKPHKQDVREGGLDGVLQGLDDLRNGKIRGAKVVVKA